MIKGRDWKRGCWGLDGVGWENKEEEGCWRDDVPKREEDVGCCCCWLNKVEGWEGVLNS